MKPLTKHSIENLLFDTTGVIHYDTKKYIEVQPGVMTPLVVNIKATFKDFKVRSKIAKELAKQVSPESICICGIESGGSYYASIVADLLKKPLVLFRKKSKQYGLGQRFVGEFPSVKNGLITIIDDVMGEGKISTANAEELMQLGYRVEICSIYSYLPEMKEFISKIKIASLSDINSLCQAGLERCFFSEDDVKLIKKECFYSSK
ncbi:MAG: phosphoribosyltransferase family protein [bacterium]|nr:phosphoribosyltransferase family protein [bacterium]